MTPEATTPEGWRRIDAILHAALDRPSDERSCAT
jgi:hypothetical protein